MVGLLLAVLALIELPHARVNDPQPRLPYLVLALGTAAAVALCRRAPAVGLAMAWILLMVQALTGADVLLVQSAFLVLVYGCARWGRPVTVWLSGVSIPAGTVLLVLQVRSGTVGLADYRRVLGGNQHLGGVWATSVFVSASAVLGLPWLAGLVVRFAARARRSTEHQLNAERQAAAALLASGQAQAIASLQQAQVKLAHDVHDVVGHSMTVVLAQAEAAQYLDPDASDEIQAMLQNIATSARSSLVQIREVLGNGPGIGPAGQDDLDTLIDGVRNSGRDVVSSVKGTAQPLAPVVHEAAFRVLQEMLTNALRHGSRHEPICVDRNWGTDLIIEVRNSVEPVDPAPSPSTGRHGLDGMRRRLQAVNGQLAASRSEPPQEAAFVATASIPLDPLGGNSV